MPPYTFFAAAPVEAAEHYLKGGYLPINIGDTFNNGRYRVINKLGRGGHSTIWLVEDLVSKRLASLKVLSGDASKSSSELEVSQILQSAQNDQRDNHPGKAHVVTIIDTFKHTGPNGEHHCIVTEVLGMNLYPDDYGSYTASRPPRVAASIATQVALGVAYLHSRGIIHGNLRLGHVLFYSSKLQNPSPDELLQIYGEVVIQDMIHFYGTECKWDHPKLVIGVPHRQGVLDACLTPSEAIHVKIIDFGHSVLESQPGFVKSIDFGHPDSESESGFVKVSYRRRVKRPAKSSNRPQDDIDRFRKVSNSLQYDIESVKVPVIYAAPEMLFRDVDSPSHSTDVWALGVILYMIMNNNRTPFSERVPSDVDGVIAYMVLTIGKLPSRWADKWTAAPSAFDDELLRKVPILRLRNAPHAEIAEEESITFQRILYDIFHYKAEERISVHALAPRMVDWLSRVAESKLRIPHKTMEKKRIGSEYPKLLNFFNYSP